MGNPSKQFELIRLYPWLASDPVSGKVGEIYYNTTVNSLKICTNTAPLTWEIFTKSGILGQNTNAKLINGGTWSNEANTLNWSANAHIEIPGLAKEANTILAGGIALTSVNHVAYVTLNRVNTITNLSVSADLISNVPDSQDTFIIARRTSTGIVVANSFLLKTGEMLEMEGALAEINRLLGQLKLKEHETDSFKARITAAETTLLDSKTLGQALGSYLLDFDGAVINFSTGQIYKADGVTARGVNFTPYSVPVSEYFWYGISVIPTAVSGLNEQEAAVQVDFASSSNAVQANAPKPIIGGDIKLGAIQVYNNAGSIEVVDFIRLGVGSGSGSGAQGITKVTFIDPVSTTLPAGPTVTVDGIAGANDDLVLFTNLSSGNNRVYKLSGVGSSIVWTAIRAFDNQFDPTDGDMVIATSGQSFNEQIAKFDGTDFKVNDVIRLFDDVSANFWELSSIKTSTLNNNSSGTVFQVNYSGSENIIVNYSLLRGSIKETGQLLITTNGVSATVSRATSYIGDSGIAFTAALSGSDIQLNYTATNLGSNATMKYFIQRWSDSPGGPTGVPSYTGATGGGSAAGANMQVQYNNSGILAGDGKFLWDSSISSLNLNGMRLSGLSASSTINDGQASPLTIIQISDLTYMHVIIEYSIVRNNERRTGRLLVASNGTTAVLSDDYVETSPIGVVFSATMVGFNLHIQYVSTATGFTGTLKHILRRWN